MIVKEIEIDSKKVKFRASATVPRLYRRFFGRDIFKDMQSLSKKADEAEKDGKQVEIDDLEMFENVAFVMAKHADPSQPDNADDWLEQFDTFSIYQVLPQILELWRLDNATTVESKKNSCNLQGNDNAAFHVSLPSDWAVYS